MCSQRSKLRERAAKWIDHGWAPSQNDANFSLFRIATIRPRAATHYFGPSDEPWVLCQLQENPVALKVSVASP